MAIFEASRYTDKVFENLDEPNLLLQKKEFENCRFKNVVFKEARFLNSRFNECTFVNCDFSLSQWTGSTLSEVSFDTVNLSGVNWTQLHWPLVRLHSPFYFDACNLSYNSFYGLSLPNLFIERSRVYESDFREATLTQASFAESDLQSSLFMHTNLSNANFVDAINYHIDTRENNIKGASFSLPDVMSLLKCQGIKIEGYDEED
jgi:uncharacterized protein YjbI with pentapeptide repeats